ncbi:MAG: caspase family protein [Candidatus Bathyarchaeia archaeon]
MLTGSLKKDADKEVIDEGIVPYECTSKSIIWDGGLTSMFSNFETTRIVFIFDSCYAGGMIDLRIIAMACTESGVAYESNYFKNGVFTYYFVDEGIIQGEVDKYDHDGDGTMGENSDIVVEKAFDYAKAKIPEVAPQTPTISDSFKNDLLL